MKRPFGRGSSLRKNGTGRNKRRIPWRSSAYGKRVLVVDSETTVDFLLRMLYAVFHLYESDQLIREGIIIGESLKPAKRRRSKSTQMTTICRSLDARNSAARSSFQRCTSKALSAWDFRCLLI